MKTNLLAIFMAITTIVFGQKYQDMIDQGTYSIADIEAEANQYFEVKGTGRGSGYKQFQRWLYVAKRDMDENGFKRNSQQQMKSLRSYKKMMKAKQGPQLLGTSTTGSWTEVGPTYWDATSGWNSGVGRISSIGIDPTDANHIIVGSPTGGVWKTTNGGTTWSPLTDAFQTMDVWSLSISPHNASHYLWGTNREVYKSTDGGATWSATNHPASGDVIRIEHHPSDANIVLSAASSGGLYRSTNGGDSWTKITSAGSSIYDIEFKPGDPTVVYASGTTVYRSTNTGTSFTAVSSGFGTGRKMLAVTPDNPSVVYLAEESSGAFGGLYKSTNSGVSYSKIRDNSINYFGYAADGGDDKGQAPRDMDVVVSPSDENEVHLAGIQTWKSTNGGTSFALTSYWTHSGASSRGVGYCHADVDILVYKGSKIYVGSDGGFYVSDDKAATFVDKTVGMGLRQYYRIGVSKTDPNVVTGGAQDNGTCVMRGASRDFKFWLGADGMEGFVDWNNPSILYGTTQNGSLYKSTNQGNSYSGITKPSGSGTWVTPFEQDPAVANTVYVGFNEVWKSTTQGGNWTQISNFGGGTLDELKIAPTNNQYIYVADGAKLSRTTNGGSSWTTLSGTSGTINWIAVDPEDEQRVAVVTSSKVYVSTNAGTSWTNYTKNLPTGTSFYCAQWQKGADNGLYVGGNGFVMYIDDNLTNYVDFMAGLPNVRVYELEINYVSEKIFAGTYGRGLWESDIYGAQVNDYDAALTDLLSPTETNWCGAASTTLSPQVKLKNLGAQTLTSATIKIAIDGVEKSSFAWTGSIATQASEVVILPNVVATADVNSQNLTIIVSQPNGQSDMDITNDTLAHSFKVINGKPISMTLAYDDYPSETTWEIKTAGGTVLYSGAGSDGGTDFDFCLEDGCYEFIIKDSYGDGMSVGGNPDYKIIDDNDLTEYVAMSAANFGAEKIHNFCISTVSYQNEAAVLTISSVPSTLCGSSVDPAVLIKNNGTATLTSLVLEVYVDNALVKTVNHTTSLTTGQSETVTITGVGFSNNGSQEVKVVASSPNGMQDENTANDEKKTTVDVTVGTPHEFYIADRSANGSLSWVINDGASNVVTSTGLNSVVTGNDQITEFCLSPGCYDFTITDAFTAGGCSSEAWDVNKVYLGDAGLGSGLGEVVSFGGKEYRAQWWVQGGDNPDVAPVWLLIGDCNVTYDADYYGVREKGQSSYFEVQLKDYTSPKTNTVGAAVAPSISIALAAGETWPICIGQTIVLEANVANGGASPVVTWFVGSTQVQQGASTTYTYTGDIAGGVISATLNSSLNCVTGNNVSSNDVTASVDICTSVNTADREAIVVFPNPTAGLVTVQIAGEATDIQVLDFQSKAIYNEKVNGRKEIKINFSLYATGTYVVQLTMADGTVVSKEVQRK